MDHRGYLLRSPATNYPCGIATSASLVGTTRTYDAVGNVATVATTLVAGTDNQVFCYDEQNWLWSAASTGTPPCTGTAITPGTLTSAQYSVTYSYDALNRLRATALGSYSYGDSAHVHAATGAGLLLESQENVGWFENSDNVGHWFAFMFAVITVVALAVDIAAGASLMDGNLFAIGVLTGMPAAGSLIYKAWHDDAVDQFAEYGKSF